VKNVSKVNALLSLAVLGVGMMAAGCKSAPDLTQDQAKSMIQAKYDATAPAGASITVNNDGMVQGAAAKYWSRTTIYPNKYWADFTLTADGKKVLKLDSGGDVIKWRPDSPTDSKFTIVVDTVQANHLKVLGIKDVQDNASGGKTVSYNEGVDLTGVPDPLQAIAHNPGNYLSTSRTANFALTNGAWAVQSIQ
jgi:hypothetical protein